MKILLIGEASGVHRNLKKGFEELGHTAFHIIKYSEQQGRSSDASFCKARNGILGGISRNISSLHNALCLEKYDVINFLNTITAVHGRYTRYLDLPIIRNKAKIMSYYAVGCDELGIIRRSDCDFAYIPCPSCLGSGETLGRDCEEFLNPLYKKSGDRARRYFDVAGCSMIEYDHTSTFFGEKSFCRVPLPVDTDAINFSPARNRKIVKIAHTPSRRGFKGTTIVLEAIDILRKSRNDFEFKIIEGLNFEDYLNVIRDVDIVVDQVYSQSPGMNALEMLAAGKIVFTGATKLGQTYYDFMHNFPGVNAEPNPTILAESLSFMLDKRNSYSEFGFAGREYIEKNHSCVYSAQKFLNLWLRK